MTEIERTDVGRIVQKAQEVLANDRIILVIGWEARNHDQHTRALEEDRRVRFRRAGGSSFPTKTGIVLSTRFVGHRDSDRAGKLGVSMYHLTVGKIREVLRGCVPIPSERPVVYNDKEEQVPMRQRVSIHPEKYKAFAQEFLKLAGNEPAKALGRSVTRGLIAQIFEGENINAVLRHLLADEWLEGVVAEGKRRASTYRLRERAEDALTAPQERVESSDPLQRARALIAKREEEVREKMRGLQEELDRIERAKELLAELEKLVP